MTLAQEALAQKTMIVPVSGETAPSPGNHARYAVAEKSDRFVVGDRADDTHINPDAHQDFKLTTDTEFNPRDIGG